MKVGLIPNAPCICDLGYAVQSAHPSLRERSEKLPLPQLKHQQPPNGKRIICTTAHKIADEPPDALLVEVTPLQRTSIEQKALCQIFKLMPDPRDQGQGKSLFRAMQDG